MAEYKEELNHSHEIPQEVLDSETERYLKKHVVATFGHVPITRPDGIERLLCANVNGLATAKVRNYKVAQIKSITHEYNVNGLVLVEHGLNMSNLKSSLDRH